VLDPYENKGQAKHIDKLSGKKQQPKREFGSAVFTKKLTP